MKTCKATTKAGAPCRATPLPGAGYCFAHDSRLAKRREEGRRRGGRQRMAALKAGDPLAERPSLRTPAEVLGVLENVLALLAVGRVGEARARTVGYLAQVALRALDFRFEERLSRLEASLGIDGMEVSHADFESTNRPH